MKNNSKRVYSFNKPLNANLMLQIYTWFVLNKYLETVVEKQGKWGRDLVDFPIRAENNRWEKEKGKWFCLWWTLSGSEL